MGLANQSATPGRTTLLEAVNVLLENIGEAPVETLENEQIAEARVAERTLLVAEKIAVLRGLYDDPEGWVADAMRMARDA